MPLAPSQRPLAEEARPAFDAGRTLGAVETARRWTVLHETPEGPRRVLLDKVAQRPTPIAVRLRPLNRWRVQWTLNRRKGRPGPAAGSQPGASGAAIVALTPRRSSVGVHLLAHWLVQPEGVTPVVARLRQAIAV